MVSMKLEKYFIKTNFMLAKLAEAVNKFKTVVEEMKFREEGQKHKEWHGILRGMVNL